jgi:L-ascorbate metabolism protein UlaG (beta-lactamase superfamily)
MRSFTYNNLVIEWLGHASFRISTKNLTIYIDPYVLPEERKQADLILVTHEHYDHCAAENIKKLIKPGGVVVATVDCIRKLVELNLKLVEPNQKIKEKGVEIETIPAYNIDKVYHTRISNWVGYIITINGIRIYHAGDTDFIPEMNNLRNIDIALLPIGGTYTMNEEEAAKAANVIRPKIVVPMHYGTYGGVSLPASPQKFASLVNKEIQVKILG